MAADAPQPSTQFCNKLCWFLQKYGDGPKCGYWIDALGQDFKKELDPEDWWQNLAHPKRN